MSTVAQAAEVTAIVVAASGPFIWLGRKLNRSDEKATLHSSALAQILRILVPEGGPALQSELVRVDTEQKATAHLVNTVILPNLGSSVRVETHA